MTANGLEPSVARRARIKRKLPLILKQILDASIDPYDASCRICGASKCGNHLFFTHVNQNYIRSFVATRLNRHKKLAKTASQRWAERLQKRYFLERHGKILRSAEQSVKLPVFVCFTCTYGTNTWSELGRHVDSDGHFREVTKAAMARLELLRNRQLSVLIKRWIVEFLMRPPDSPEHFIARMLDEFRLLEAITSLREAERRSTPDLPATCADDCSFMCPLCLLVLPDSPMYSAHVSLIHVTLSPKPILIKNNLFNGTRKSPFLPRPGLRSADRKAEDAAERCSRDSACSGCKLTCSRRRRLNPEPLGVLNGATFKRKRKPRQRKRPVRLGELGRKCTSGLKTRFLSETDASSLKQPTDGIINGRISKRGRSRKTGKFTQDYACIRNLVSKNPRKKLKRVQFSDEGSTEHVVNSKSCLRKVPRYVQVNVKAVRPSLVFVDKLPANINDETISADVLPVYPAYQPSVVLKGLRAELLSAKLTHQL